MSPRSDAATRLFEETARAARRPGAERVIFLDLDGTLAPIVTRPEDARVPKPTQQAMRSRISRRWTIAIVSGRPASSLRRIVQLPGLHLFGSHGLEGAWPGSSRHRPSAALRCVVRRILLEGRRALWARRVRDLLAASDLRGLEIIRGRRVIEVRPAAWSKGNVVATRPGRKRASTTNGSLLAIGDDITDEDMFHAIREVGVGVLVCPRIRSSAATRRLAPPRQVWTYLDLLALSDTA